MNDITMPQISNPLLVPSDESLGHLLYSLQQKTKPMNVLSLFDGMSCGQIALRELGIKVDRYYASEINKHAIKQTQLNFPDTIQLGDVRGVHAKDLPKIDLLIGGSPCQGFSFAGKQLNFNDPRSALFFEFVRILNECREINPDVKFLLENVRMKRECEQVISDTLGIKPVMINSALVSAQNRVRLYWSNIRTAATDCLKSRPTFRSRKTAVCFCAIFWKMMLMLNTMFRKRHCRICRLMPSVKKQEVMVLR